MGPLGFVYFDSGSSPRMRGALGFVVGDVKIQRIIPADAGSTQWFYAEPGQNMDHPRGCGEHIGHGYPNCDLEGSSPRMRGARTPSQVRETPGRIIPADAGSTDAGHPPDTFDEDHPRGCGEHSKGYLSVIVIPGSSPRMRGAPHAARRQPSRQRIIPADAGSTSLLSACHVPGWDHPRGCGEHRLGFGVIL